MVTLALSLHNENVDLKQFISLYPLVKLTSFNFWLSVLDVFYLFMKISRPSAPN